MYFEALAVFVTLPFMLLVEGAGEQPPLNQTVPFNQSNPSFNRTLEREIMLKFRDSFGSSAPRGWSDDNYCQWNQTTVNNRTMRNVVCDPSGRVRELRVIGSGLADTSGSVPTVSLQGNQLPKELPSLSALERLNLNFHSMKVTLPEEWGYWSSLQVLSLSQLTLVGELPGSFVNLKNLTTLNLGNNELTGRIPDWIGTLPKLEVLDLSNNLWDYGMLPDTLSLLKRIKSISFEGANLRGGIPDWLRNLTTLEGINLPVNLLKSEVPHWLLDGSMQNLTRVALNQNELYGQLPTSLGINLKTVFLQFNYFSGKIPTSTQNTTQYIYTSNCFSGDIFADVSQRPRAECDKFNEGLNDSPKRNGKGTRIAIIVGATIVSVFVLICAMLLAFYVKKRRGSQALVFQNVDLTDGVVKVFSISEIKKATSKFTTEIGRGGFATVYRAKLRDGTEVAVKRLASRRRYDPNAANEFAAFEREVALIARLHHRFLVNLVGYCMDNDERMLIFEYIPNGTLSQALFARGRSVLAWGSRMRIAVHVAKGIEYLHYGANPPVLHRDIKSGNILLGEDHSAKVADFGLSREARVNDSAEGPLTTGTLLKGTLGYTDPEYIRTGKLSEKSDVYSFGIVLLELVTGKRAKTTTPYPGTTATSLTEWCEFFYRNPGLVGDMVDPQLQGNFDWDELRIVASIAHDCVYLDSVDRPSMREVVTHLQTISSSEKAMSDGEVSHGVGDKNAPSSNSISDSHKTKTDTDSQSKSDTLTNLLEKEKKLSAFGHRFPLGYSNDYSSQWKELLGQVPPMLTTIPAPPNTEEPKSKD